MKTYSDRQLAKTATRILGFVLALGNVDNKVFQLSSDLVFNGDEELRAQMATLTKEVAEELKAEVEGTAEPLPRPTYVYDPVNRQMD